MCGALALLLCFPHSVALAIPRNSDTSTPQSAKATIWELDIPDSQVTYVLPDGQPRTSPVSSKKAMEKLAKMTMGQGVILKCRVTGAPGQCPVEDVKKKPNWLTRGPTIAAVVVTVGMAALFIDSTPVL
jgi:hypothetical protein